MTCLELAGVNVLSDYSLHVNPLRAGIVSYEHQRPIRKQLSCVWDVGLNNATVCASPSNTGC